MPSAVPEPNAGLRHVLEARAVAEAWASYEARLRQALADAAAGRAVVPEPVLRQALAVAERKRAEVAPV